MSDQALQRVLPLATTACVDAVVVEEFESFRRELGGPEGCIAVISPDGTCVWSSTESFSADACRNLDVNGFHGQILNALGGDSAGDVPMTGG
jgi:hypothetical protein